MIDEAELLDQSLDGDEAVMDARVRELVQLALQVSRALAAQRLSPELRDRIRAKAFAAAQHANRERLVPDFLRRPRALAGGAALTLAAAAVGVALLRARRQHAQAIA
jgi:hypothetical protein